MLGKIKSFGGFMALAGVISAVLSLVGYELKLLMWIDMWGTGVGWGIRAALVVVGLAIVFMLPSDDAEDEAPQAGA